MTDSSGLSTEVLTCSRWVTNLELPLSCYSEGWFGLFAQEEDGCVIPRLAYFELAKEWSGELTSMPMMHGPFCGNISCYIQVLNQTRLQFAEAAVVSIKATLLTGLWLPW